MPEQEAEEWSGYFKYIYPEGEANNWIDGLNSVRLLKLDGASQEEIDQFLQKTRARMDSNKEATDRPTDENPPLEKE